ncbi:MAG TPA: 50S ribosomal protein L34e [Candidatus Nanoarchaeia archaeon]|nr:50S ribosomal protein L34e [Candidatus Nanoarchaeia archaeon]
MVRPQLRSRSYRRVFRKTPGGRVAVHFVERKPQRAKCGNCGSILHGIKAERPTKMANTNKTAKRPERPYGGVLCSRCMREQIKKSIIS